MWFKLRTGNSTISLWTFDGEIEANQNQRDTINEEIEEHINYNKERDINLLTSNNL